MPMKFGKATVKAQPDRKDDGHIAGYTVPRMRLQSSNHKILFSFDGVVPRAKSSRSSPNAVAETVATMPED
jgi:hypothetical protein